MLHTMGYFSAIRHPYPPPSTQGHPSAAAHTPSVLLDCHPFNFIAHNVGPMLLPPPRRRHRAITPRVFYRPTVPLEVSAFLRGLVRRAAPRGLRDPAEDVRAAAARAVRLVMRRFLLQQSRANGGGSEILVHAVQRRENGVGGSDTGSGVVRGSGGSGGGNGGDGIDGGEVFDLVWEALEGLDQDSACVEVRVPWGMRCVF